jgi:V8-like Glu-specific endopeptidase
MSDTEEEKSIEKYPFEVNIQRTETILHQLKNCVCKIYNKEKGTGFFCKITYRLNNTILSMDTLITCNHVLNEKDLIPGKTITLSFNDEKNSTSFNIGNERITFTDPKNDITIIEMKNKDPVKYECLQVHDNLFSNVDLKKFFSKKPIYVLHNPDNNTLISYGTIKKIKGGEIQHCCSTKYGSSGGPILALDNNKVIGVHKGSSKKLEFNKGNLLLIGIIQFLKSSEFQKKIQNNFQVVNKSPPKIKNIKQEIDKISNISKDTSLEGDSRSEIDKIIKFKRIDTPSNQGKEKEFIIL